MVVLMSVAPLQHQHVSAAESTGSPFGQPRAVWAVAFFTLRYVSVASLLAAVSLPLTVGVLWRTGRTDGLLFALSVLAAALAWWRHRANLQRLLAGTEPRFERKVARGG